MQEEREESKQGCWNLCGKVSFKGCSIHQAIMLLSQEFKLGFRCLALSQALQRKTVQWPYLSSMDEQTRECTDVLLMMKGCVLMISEGLT